MNKFAAKTVSTFLAACTSLFAPFSAFSLFASADTGNVSSLEEAMRKAPVISESELVFPTADGYTLSLFGSENKQVITLDGKVISPLTDMTVNLIYKATAVDGTVIEGEENVEITVPGQYEKTPQDNPKPDVLPSLREWKGFTGEFVLTDDSKIVSTDPALDSAANILKEYISKVSGISLQVVSDDSAVSGNIVLSLGYDESIGDEGYFMEIGDNVSLSAYSVTGIIYGTSTISQILYGSENKNTLPKGLIRDYPAYEVRGLMLDIARTWFDIDTLTQLGKYMAYYKLNTLHLHLNESKIRVENETQPSFTFDSPQYYTKQQYSDFTDTLATYGVEIVNEIDTPAHATGFKGILPMLDDHRLDIIDPENRAECEALIKQMYDEYLVGTENYGPLSKNGVLHIGGDEFYWTEKDVASDAYKEYMIDMFNYVISKGAEVRNWTWIDQFNAQNMPELCGSFTEEELERITDRSKVTSYIWDNGTGNVNTVLDFGFNVINAEYRRLYLVPFNSIFPMQFIDQAMYFDTWDVTDFRDGYILPKGHPKNKGAIGSLWNDAAGNGATYHDLMYRAKGLLMILSEKCWYGSKTEDQTVENYLERIDTLGAFSPSSNIFSHVESLGSTVASFDFENSASDSSGNGSGNRGWKTAFLRAL